MGTIRNGNITVEAGEAIRFVMSGADGDKTSIPLPHPEIFAAIAPGQDLLIDNGRVRVQVTDLVARFNQIDGYRCLSLMRALAVVKCQSALA